MEQTEAIHSIAAASLFRNRLKRGNELLRRYCDVSRLWKELREDGKEAALRQAEQEWDFISDHSINITTPLKDDYPSRLAECTDAPMVLFGKGNINLKSKHVLSVVGTRGCTERGKETTRRIVAGLASMFDDLVIVSGLAYGIDIAAHRAAIEAGAQTIAVLGHGLDRIYPALHRNTAITMLKNGGLITEYLSRTDPDRFNFIARDRIIAGISDAVLVVESREKGGALYTAGMAFDYSRPVFAVPGRADDICSKGCNRLIKDHKAFLAENAEDIAKAMMWEDDASQQPKQSSLTELLEGMSDEEARIIQLLKKEEDGMHINDMLSTLRLQYATLVTQLMTMEMKGWVKSLPGGIYRAVI